MAALSFAVHYALAARTYFSVPPTPADPIAAFNAALPQAPEAEHAVPAYIALDQAWLNAKPDLPDPLPYNWWSDLGPGDPHFAPVTEAIRTLEPQLAEARRSSVRPILGSRLIPATPEHQRERGWPELDEAMTHALINTHIVGLTETSRAVNLLLLDAAHAAEHDDPARFAADVHAVLGIARQIREIPFFINDIIAIRAVNNTAVLIRRVLATRPDLLDAPALAALQDHLADAARNHAVLRIDSERANIADLIDRTFTPGPDGRITAAGIERLHPLIQFGDPNDSMFPAIPDPGSPLAPLHARRIATRADQLGWYDAYLNLAKAAQAQGPAGIAGFYSVENAYLHGALSVTCTSFRCGTENNQPCPELRYAPTYPLTPSIGSALHTEQHARLEAEATLVALAVERFRHDHARLPNTLDQLVPAYLAALPADPFDSSGSPIKYLAQGNTFTLYFNGANRIDDHAAPPPPNPGDPHGYRRLNTGQPDPNAPKADWILFPPPTDPTPVY